MNAQTETMLLARIDPHPNAFFQVLKGTKVALNFPEDI